MTTQHTTNKGFVVIAITKADEFYPGRNSNTKEYDDKILVTLKEQNLPDDRYATSIIMHESEAQKFYVGQEVEADFHLK
jgi:predicted transcriptional regulator